jgi:NADPH2:quinone reductase
MRALTCNKLGSTDDLVIEERDAPEPGDRDILVDVRAAGVNFPDLLIVAGKYQEKMEPPFVPGNEAAGTVRAVGAAVTRFSPGDAVIVLPRGGAFAEQCVVHEEKAAPMPAGLNFEQAAAFGVAYGTSYHALKQAARIEPGETLLVLGAAGGVGTAAVALGKCLGARVIAAASSSGKLEHARAAGADDLIDYTESALKESVRELTDGKGVDVVYDPVGGAYAEPALRALAWHGRYLVVGFATGDIPSLPLNIVLLKEASIVGVYWGAWVARHPQDHAENMRELSALIADGALVPELSEVYEFADFRNAFRQISERRALGKVVIRIS